MLKGGSAKTRSTEPAGRSFMPAMQSPWWILAREEAGTVPTDSEEALSCFLPAMRVVLEGRRGDGWQYSRGCERARAVRLALSAAPFLVRAAGLFACAARAVLAC